MVPRWQRNGMGRPLSPQQIHQKIIWMLSNFHKTTSERWWRTPDTQKGSPITLPLPAPKKRVSNATWWPLVLSQNKGLCMRKYRKITIWLSFRALPPQRQRASLCDSQIWKARGCCNLAPRDCIFHQTVSGLPVANHIFLGSCIVHICQ